MIEFVDPFLGSGATDLPSPDGLAATWWWPKPQVGNTHPGACAPLGMVSASAYSGAYPTGYGLYEKSTEGVPVQRFDRQRASGFTHFQQSGTGAIRKYYNYLRVSPMLEPLDELGKAWDLDDEVARPGFYGALLDSAIGCELTVGPRSAVHRYTFPEHRDSRLVIDFSTGGLEIEHGQTVPMRADLSFTGPGQACGTVVVEGVPLSVYIECDGSDWRQMLWYDRRLMAGGTRLDFDSIRPTTLRPFGLIFMGPTETGRAIEVRLGFSLRGPEQAKQNLLDDCGPVGPSFEHRSELTRLAWAEHLDNIEVDGGSRQRRTIFATALYHSLIKPSFAADESPFWPMNGPWVFDVSTMWDIYKTQLPLLTVIAPSRAIELANALLLICQEEGNFPIGYRMARGADRFYRQASALAHTFFADLAALELPGIDWEWALVHLHADLLRSYGEDFLDHGIAYPISHTIDLADGYYATARIARLVGDDALADQLLTRATNWRNAFDPGTGLLVDSTFYEGGRWNYSFRLLHDMAARIELAGGEEDFEALLDRFFGFGADPVKQLGVSPTDADVAAGYALNRFQGLNNEPDMEAPWAYHFAGRPDRTTDVVHAILTNQFGTGRGGLPGNDDSGGLSSWFVWAALGLFPVAGQGLFLLNSPAFERSEITTDTGTTTIETTGFVEPTRLSSPNYVQEATIDGRPLERSWLTSSELRTASSIRLELGPQPSSWGSESRPPSASTTPAAPAMPAVTERTKPS